MSRHYPDWIDAFVQTFDAKTEAPARLLFWTAVATIGGALTRRVFIDEVIFKLYPNWYVVFVAPPGIVTKSTTISFGTNILREMDNIYLSADNTTYPAFVQDLAAHYEELLHTDAADVEDALYIRQCAVTAAISEFGTFFKPEDEDMVNGLTDLWDCRPLVVKDTKHNGTDILEHPFVNILAGTTTKWIKDKIKLQIGGWGLSSRIIFVYESKKSKFVARPSKLWQPGEYDRISAALLDDLREIGELSGPMEFTPGADALADQWYNGHAQRMEAHGDADDADPWLGYFLARKQAHIHKLAMCLSVSRRSTLIITEDDFKDALAKVNEVELEVPWIFKHVSEPTAMALLEQDCVEKILDLIKEQGGEARRFDCYSKIARLVDSSTAKRFIENAIGRRTLSQRIAKGGVEYLKAGVVL